MQHQFSIAEKEFSQKTNFSSYSGNLTRQNKIGAALEACLKIAPNFMKGIHVNMMLAKTVSNLQSARKNLECCLACNDDPEVRVVFDSVSHHIKTLS